MVKKSIKTILTVSFSIVSAVFFMWLAMNDLDIDKIKSSIYEANYFWIVVSIFFVVLAYWLRAVRWNMLLEPMGYRISNSNSFWAISFGYMLNLTIPRSGEVARATALFGVEKVPVNKSFATIVVERVIDLFFIVVFLFLTFLFNSEVLLFFFEKVKNYKSDSNKELGYFDKFLIDLGIESIDSLYFNIKVIALLILLLLMILFFIKYKNKFINLVKGVLEGLISIFKIKEKIKFIFYSTGIWVCYFLAAYLVCFSLEDTSIFTFRDGLLILTAGTFGMMIPTSGGAGSYHIAVKLAILGIFNSLGKDANIGEEIGLTYAIISHTSQTIVTIVLGLISIFMLFRNKK